AWQRARTSGPRQAARRKGTIKHLPKRTRTVLGKEGAKAARRNWTSSSAGIRISLATPAPSVFREQRGPKLRRSGEAAVGMVYAWVLARGFPMNRLLASVPAFGLLSSLVACGTHPDA